VKPDKKQAERRKSTPQHSLLAICYLLLIIRRIKAMKDHRTLPADPGIEELDEQLRLLSRRLVKTEKEFREAQRLLAEMKAWLSILAKFSREQSNKTQVKRYMEQAGKSQTASQAARLPGGNEIS
jgi:hypothetical protein